jgi:hypothetical protein
MGGLCVCLLALAGVLSSARAVAIRPSAASVGLTFFFFLTLIATVDHKMGII